MKGIKMDKIEQEETAQQQVMDLVKDIDPEEFLESFTKQLEKDKSLARLAEIIITKELPKEYSTVQSARDFSFDRINDYVGAIAKHARHVDCLMKLISIMFVFHNDTEGDKEHIINMLGLLIDIFGQHKKRIDNLQQYLDERKAI